MKLSRRLLKPRSLLGLIGPTDYLISMIDWDANVNPEFAKSNKTKPRPLKSLGDAQ